MFNYRTTRIGILFAVLILALGAVGIGSALWSETLTIEGDVTTGNVDVEFDVVWLNDDVSLAGDCVLGGTMDALTVTITDAYPTYECSMQFDVMNVGSIPVLVDEPVWVMPPEITVVDNVCYGNDYLLEAGFLTGPCNMTFVVGDVAESSSYTFSGSVFAEQVTTP